MSSNIFCGAVNLPEEEKEREKEKRKRLDNVLLHRWCPYVPVGTQVRKLSPWANSPSEKNPTNQKEKWV
jgi:hypothetical protein